MKKFLIITAIVCMVSFCLGGMSLLFFDTKGIVKAFNNSAYHGIGFNGIERRRELKKLESLEKLDDKAYELYEKFYDKFEDDFIDGISDGADNLSDAVTDAVDTALSGSVRRGISRYVKGLSELIIDETFGGDGYFDKDDITKLETHLKIVDEKEEAAKNINSVNISSKDSDVIIYRGRGDKIKAYALKKRFSYGNVKTDFSMDKNTLNIDVKASRADSRVYVLIPDSFNGDINVSSVDGDLIFAKIKQNLNANIVDGDIIGEISPDSDCALDTSDGDIVASLKNVEDMNASIKLSSNDGDIVSGIPFKKFTSVDNNEYTYKIKDGKNQIVLSTNDGDIIVE